MTPMEIYGLLLGAVLLLCWASGDHTIQRLGLWMLVSWAGSNIIVEWLGFSDAPLVAPAFNAFVAIMVAILGYRTRSYATLTVFLLFFAEQSINWLAYANHLQGTYAYYAVLNGVFVLRMCVVGGFACVHLGDRFYSSHGGAHLGHQGGDRA